MTADRPLLLAGPPAHREWEYGGFPYGLEPLTLPAPGRPDAPTDHDGHRLDESCRRIRAIGEDGMPDGRIPPPENPAELFWFRWITGHQVSFVLWRMIGQLTDDLRRGRRPRAAVRYPLSQYMQGYCAMLLYTGSCDRETYHAVIRPSMRLQHPSFSGSWAPDYMPVRDLFRGRMPELTDCADVARTLHLHELAHTYVAAKLVPDGRSLLHQSPVRRHDMRLLHALYDNYFLTLRGRVSRPDVDGQLLRRLVAVAQDLAVNTLHPFGVRSDEEPPEACTPEITGCSGALAEILTRVAGCVAGLPATRDDDPRRSAVGEMVGSRHAG
jgi:hypothetical protein